MQKQENEELKAHVLALQHLAEVYPEEIQVYAKTARHIEDTDQCMITLPCKNKDKRLIIFAVTVD